MNALSTNTHPSGLSAAPHTVKYVHRLTERAGANRIVFFIQRLQVLTTPTHVLLDIDHSVEITASGGLEKSPMAAECLYKASKGDLLMKLKLTSAQKGELKAEYKLDKLTAMATVPITSLNAQGLGQPMLEIKSNYDF